jgi:26S proteasome regulatory subunit N5
MISYALQSSKYLDLCKYFRSIFEMPSVQADESKWSLALKFAVYFVVLSPKDNEQNDLLERLKSEEKLGKVEECEYVPNFQSRYNSSSRLISYRSLVKCFTTPELIRWSLIQQHYGRFLRQSKVFAPNDSQSVLSDLEEDTPRGEKRWEDLHKRVTEHVRPLILRSPKPLSRVISEYPNHISLLHSLDLTSSIRTSRPTSIGN